MNNASIDYLLQITVPRSEPAPATRPRDNAPAFDDHFRQADPPSRPAAAPSQAPARESHAAKSADKANEPATSEQTAENANASGTDSAVRKAAAESPDGDRDDDVPAEEAAEVAAVLAAAEQSAKGTDGQASVAIDEAEQALHADADAANTAKPVQADPQSRRTQAADAAEATKAAAKSDATAVDLPAGAANEASQAESTPEQMTLAGKTVAPADAPTEAAVARGAGRDATGREPVEKVSGGNDESGKGAETHDAQAKSSADSSGAAARGADAHDAPLVTQSAGERDDASDRRDKRTAARAPATPGDAATTTGDRTVPAARAADSPAVAPVIAAVQAPTGAAAAADTAQVAKPNERSTAAQDGPLSPLARLDRGDAKGVRTSGRTNTTHVDPARFVSRVARAINTAQERGGPLHLRLSPPELGSMRLELAVNQGALTATIETDNSAARQLLIDNLPLLRDRLAEQNVKIDRFDVDVRSDSGGFQQNRGPQDGNNDSRNSRAAQQNTGTSREVESQVVDQPVPNRRTITSTTINVIA